MNLVERILPGLGAYPDIHPMVVHFPAALFPVALLLALTTLARPRVNLAAPARLLLVLGTLGAAASVTTGLLAQEAMPHGRGTLVAAHRSFMLATSVVALLLSGVSLRRRDPPSGTALRVLVVGLLAVNVLLVLGADRGALVALRLRSGLDLALPAVTGPPAAPQAAVAEADSARGRSLYARLECAACHESGAGREAPGIPPSLAFAGSKLREDWTRRYLLSPHRIRFLDVDALPVARMPEFQLSPIEAADLAAFLATRTGPAALFASAPVEDSPLTEEEAREGRDLVGQYACKGCHMIGGTGNSYGPVLDGAGDRLRPGYVYAFLRDPRAIIPGTPMKNFHLWADEARSLTAYLMTLRTERRP